MSRKSSPCFSKDHLTALKRGKLMKTIAVLGYFDRECSSIIKDLKERINRKSGLNTSSLLDVPHITFTISNGSSPDKVEKAIAELRGSKIPDVTFSHFGLFKAKRTLFLGINPSCELLMFHKKVFDRVSPVQREMSPFYSPSNWVPHCFLADSFNCFSDILEIALEPVFFKSFGVTGLSVTEYDHDLGRMVHKIDIPR